ncbi:MAG: ATP phosphoribosyltransferase regulatory subunit [Aestuariivirga sp.]
MPERWRRRLQHQFWRPEAFKSLLQSFAAGAVKKRSSISDVVDTLASTSAGAAAAAWIDKHNLPQQGARGIEEVADRLAEKFADRSEAPLSTNVIAGIENYLSLHGGASDIGEALRAIASGPAYSAACAAFEKRLTTLEEQGLNSKRFQFSASFGREIEYYTGFVFQIEVGDVAVAGGGRYDGMLRDLGAQMQIPAFGFAIHTERLQAVLT